MSVELMPSVSTAYAHNDPLPFNLVIYIGTLLSCLYFHPRLGSRSWPITFENWALTLNLGDHENYKWATLHSLC